MNRNYIAGEWVASDDAVENRNPSDVTDLVGLFAQAGTAHLETAIEAAGGAQKIWQATGLEARQTALMKIGNALIDRADKLGELLSREEGKPRAEGRGEVYRAGQFFTYYAAEVLRQIGDNADSVRPGIEIDVRRDPVGVVAVISPWNFPTATAVWKIAPALCRWFMELMSPAVDAYHNLKQRKIVETAVMTAAETGVLMELYNIYADQKTIQRDQQGYTRAQQEHQTCEMQVRQLTAELDNKEHMANELGEQAAAVTSGVIGSIGSTIIIIIFML